MDVICEGSIESINNPVETQRTPVLLPPNSKSCSILAREDCIICHANRDILDTIIAWDHIGRESSQPVKYIDIIRNTLVFSRLPIEFIESAFSRMRPCKMKQDESIEPGNSDAYYLILSGRAEVQRLNSHHVTELSTGDIFGTEAQVAGKNLSETIVMLEDSELLVLGLKDYNELINRPRVKTIQPKIAQTMLDNGYQLLDVRYPEEYSVNRISEAKLIPLAELAQRLNELDQDQPYIIYCHSGPRSAIAALILSRNKFEALSLLGGIRDWPYEIEYSTNRSNIVSLTKKFH